MSSDEFESSQSIKVKKSKKASKHRQDIDDQPTSSKKPKHGSPKPTSASISCFAGNSSLQSFLNSSNKLNELLNKSKQSLQESTSSSKVKKGNDNVANSTLSLASKIKGKRKEVLSESKASENEHLNVKSVKGKKALPHTFRSNVSNEDSDSDDASQNSEQHKRKDVTRLTEESQESEDQVQILKPKKSKKATRDKPDNLQEIENLSTDELEKSNHYHKSEDVFSNYDEASKKKKKHKHSRKQEELSSQDEVETPSTKITKTNTFAVQALENFELKNKNLEPVTYNANKALSNLTETSLMFLVELPQNFDPHCLLDKSISLHKKTKFKVNKLKYRSNPLERSSDPIVVAAHDCNTRLNPHKIINIESYSKSETVQPFSSSEKVSTSTGLSRPESVKKRNPAIGFDEQDSILSEHIKRNLQSAVKKYEESKSLAKVKTENPSNLEGEEIFKYLTQPQEEVDFGSKSKIKTKRKREPSNVFSSEESDVKQHKKKSKMANDGLLSPKVTNVKQETDEATTEPKKQKKKKSKQFDALAASADDMSSVTTADESSSVKSKKHKKNKAVNCEVEANAILNSFWESSSQEHKKHKKKKNKKEINDSRSEATELISVVTEEIQTPEEVVRKKKKKKKHDLSEIF